MARLYANENFPFPVVAALRQLGHDTLTTFESGRAGLEIPDDDVLAFALQAKRALLTINRKHFVRLHRANPHHAGIIACTFDPDFLSQARRIHDALASAPDLNGQLIRVNRVN